MFHLIFYNFSIFEGECISRLIIFFNNFKLVGPNLGPFHRGQRASPVTIVFGATNKLQVFVNLSRMKPLIQHCLLAYIHFDPMKQVTDLGKPLGAPWSQDEKYAALAAWLALADKDGSGARRKSRLA